MTADLDPAAFAQRRRDACNARDIERFAREYTDDVQQFRLPDAQPFVDGKAAFVAHDRDHRFHRPGLQAAPMEVAAICEVAPAGICRARFVSGA